MAKPSEKLAESLEVLHALQERGLVVIRSGDLTRAHRERLSRNGFLQEIIKGWYIPARPDETAGESTAWYASFWQFCVAYLTHLKEDDWCLSAEQSLSLHAENWTVPRQLIVRATKARNNVTPLPHDTSLLVIRAEMPKEDRIVVKHGLRLYSMSSALISCSPEYYRRNPTDMRAALSMVRDASEVLEPLLEGGHSTIAGRLSGAFRNVGKDELADEILNTMRATGYDVRETDPFEHRVRIQAGKQNFSPYVQRIQLMWQDMRETIIDRFPAAPGLPGDASAYLKRVDDVYVTDAYHSLSIEGYRVSPELIKRVHGGSWNPEQDDNDREHHNALAARGYWQAYQAVHTSIEKVLKGDNPGAAAADDHRIWYREMFVPSITAGLLRPTDLAGYRNAPVYIRGSMHVPPSSEAVRDAMPAFFELLSKETEASVRVVLGHFIFVYIHPYMDGNGRIGRFLMNVMLAAGGYPWAVVPMEMRDAYMAALEEASVNQDVGPFTDFLAELVTSEMA